MCRMCDGASWQDLADECATTIAVHGYTMQGVGDDDHAPWVYTVGLLDSADHPELIVAGPSTDMCVHVLAELADSVIEGKRYALGDRVSTRHGTVRIGAVHSIQYELGTFNAWYEMQGAGVIDTLDLTAFQVILGPQSFCAEHQGAQPPLSEPFARVGQRPPPPNRAARRRRRGNT